MKFRIAIAVGSALLSIGVTQADTDTQASKSHQLDEDLTIPGRTHVRYSFRELDLNNDGSLVRTEVAFKPELAANFAYADRNGNGTLNRPEFESAVALSAQTEPSLEDLGGATARGTARRQ